MPESTEKIKGVFIKENEKINVEITSDLYLRLQKLAFEALPFKDLPDFKQCMHNVRSGKIENKRDYHMHTILFVLNLIEDAAKAQDKTFEKDVSPSDFKQNPFPS